MGGLLDLGGDCEQIESLDTLKVFISSATRLRLTWVPPLTPDSVRLEADITQKSFPETEKERERWRGRKEIKQHMKYKFTRPLVKVGRFH